MAKERLDIYMVSQGLASSRERAKALIMAGDVAVEGKPVTKAGTMIAIDANVVVRQKESPYVSRGGLKLEKALEMFGVDIADKVCIDVGASTGGFTECLLNAGAKKVYAVDVGYGQLAWTLRNDPRVVVMERTNARNLQPEDIEEPPEIASMDVSFISIIKILPALKRIGVGQIVSLIKPQFEAGRQQVGKKGIVKDMPVHEAVLLRIKKEAAEEGYALQAITFSPITGQNGNIEFLGHFVRKEPIAMLSDAELSNVVKQAHEFLRERNG